LGVGVSGNTNFSLRRTHRENKLEMTALGDRGENGICDG
jgi:hypothetical protein